MGEKQKLELACELLRKRIKESDVIEEVNDKYHKMALRGSVQSRKARKILVRS